MPTIIPEYSQRTRASTGSNTVPLRDARGESSGFFALARAFRDIKDARERVAEEDAAVWATENLSKAQAHWSEQMLTRKDEAEPGAPEFTPTTLADYDKYTEELVAQAPTQRSRLYMKQRLEAYRLHLQQDAMIFQSVSSADHAVRTIDDATDRKRQVVQVSPDQFEAMREEQIVLIDSTRLPEVRKDILRNQVNEILARDAVIGLINRNPYSTLKALNQEPGKSEVTAIESLNADDRLQLRNQAEAEIHRREAEQKAKLVEARNALDDSRKDAFAAKAAGLPAQLPGRSLYVAVDPKEGAKRYAQDAQLMATYDAASAAVMLPPAEGLAVLSQFKPTQQEGAAAQAEVQQQAMQLYAHQRQQFEKDPVTPIVRQDQQLTDLLIDIGEGEATPEQIEQYVNRVRSKQEAAGLLDTRLLPENYANRLTDLLAFNPEKPGARADTMQGIRQQWGTMFPQVMREIAPKLEGDARVMVAMRPEVAKQYDQALAAAEKIRSIVPSNTATQVKAKVVEELEGLAGTLIYSDDGQVRLAEIQAAAQLLAMSYARANSTPADAATRAASVVVNERYEYRDTMRIPRFFDADDVQDGALGLQLALPADQLAVQPMPGDDVASAQSDLRSFIQREGYWVTDSEEAGAELHIPYQGGSVPVTRLDGSRIRYTWAEFAAFEGREVPEYIRRGLPK